MKKTILVGLDNRYSARAQRRLYYFLSILFIAQGIISINYLFSNTASRGFKIISFILIVCWFIGAIYLTLMAVLAFSESSKYAPRIKVDDNQLELKKSVFKAAEILKWQDIKKIEFGQYQLNLRLADKDFSFTYKRNRNISLDIKKAIREIAELKNIEIQGG